MKARPSQLTTVREDVNASLERTIFVLQAVNAEIGSSVSPRDTRINAASIMIGQLMNRLVMIDPAAPDAPAPFKALGQALGTTLGQLSEESRDLIMTEFCEHVAEAVLIVERDKAVSAAHRAGTAGNA